MWKPGWEGSLGENGYMCIHGWVPLLFTWNYHNVVNWLYANTKLTVKKREASALNPGVRGPCSYNPDGRGPTWSPPSCHSSKGRGHSCKVQDDKPSKPGHVTTIGTKIPLVASDIDGSSSESHQFFISKNILQWTINDFTLTFSNKTRLTETSTPIAFIS